MSSALTSVVVKSSQLKGIIPIPPSKSHTMRSILFASMSDGISEIFNYLPSSDADALLHACAMMGAKITKSDEKITICGVNAVPLTPNDVVDAKNSGQILYYVGALSALAEGFTVITGDCSIRNNRPVRYLLKGLEQLGAYAVSTRNNDFAPIIVKGPIIAGRVEVSGEASLPVSALIIVSVFLRGTTEIIVTNPGEKPWVNLTLSWLERGGIKYENQDFRRIVIYGGGRYPSFEYTVPSDFSSAAYPIVAALLTHSEIMLPNIDMNDSQGDKKLIEILVGMGANIHYDEKQKTLYVRATQKLTGKIVDINDFIDSITILAVLGCFVEGGLEIIGARPSRYKECDRIACISTELRKMGADITEKEDGLVVLPSKLHGAEVNSYSDHRMALSLLVAGLAASGETRVNDVGCIGKSFPNFFELMSKVGAEIRIENS